MKSSRPSLDLVGALLVRQSRLLLGKRSPDKQHCPDAWDLFGGHVEPGESFEQALARELQEELGVTPVRARQLDAFELANGQEYRIFRVDEWIGGEPRVCNDEHTALGWFTVAEARRLQPLASEAYLRLFARLGT